MYIQGNISLNPSQNERCFKHQLQRQSYHLWYNVEKCGRARQATDDNIRRMRIAFWINKVHTHTHTHTDIYTHTHTQNMQNCSFSTAVMITRMRRTVLSVYAHYLSYNTTLPSTRTSSKWSVSLRSSHKNPVRTSLVSHTCHMHCPSQSSFLYHP